MGQSFTQQATADQAAISIQCAFHFEQANLLDQAVRYYIQAAAAAADLHAYDRAAQLYARAIEIAGGEMGSKKPIHPNDDVNLS